MDGRTNGLVWCWEGKVPCWRLHGKASRNSGQYLCSLFSFFKFQFFMSYCVFCYFSAALDIFFNRWIRKTAWSYVQCTIFILSFDLIHWLVRWTFAPAPGLGHSFSSYRVSSHSLSVTIFYHRHLQTIKTFKLLDFISVSVTWEFWNSLLLLLFSRSFSHFIWTTLSILLLVSFFPPWIFILFLKHWRSCSPQLDHSHHRP